MSDFGKLLEEKCMNFSIRIIGLCRFLNEEKHEYRIADQMFRSGTSIGANVAEAQCAISKSDFIAKLYISLKRQTRLSIGYVFYKGHSLSTINSLSR